MIFTSISPNTEKDDVLLAFRSLFLPWTWKKGKYPAKLEQAFKEKFSVQHAFAFQSGRNSIYALLKALNLNSEDEVLLQAYTCVAVPEPVLWVGAKPIYVDVLQNLTINPEDLKKKITARSKVLIVQHTFGMPAHLDELLAIAKQHDLFVIEDCAHALGAMHKNKYVGTFGDASFFSFGRDKVLSSVFGGILIVKDENLAEKLNQIQKQFKYPSYFSIKRQLMHPIIMAVAKPLYAKLDIGKAIIAFLRIIKYLPKAVEQRELSGGKPSFLGQKMPNIIAKLALHQFKKLERYNAHRVGLASFYQKELAGFSFQHIVPDTQAIWLRCTLFVDAPKKLILEARKEGVELGDWYSTSIAPKNTEYKKIHYNPAICPEAERLAGMSVNLPTNIQTKEKDARKIIEFIKKRAR